MGYASAVTDAASLTGYAASTRFRSDSGAIDVSMMPVAGSASTSWGAGVVSPQAASSIESAIELCLLVSDELLHLVFWRHHIMQLLGWCEEDMYSV
jgi:hypothetical protein